jgi:hypothetical protein
MLTFLPSPRQDDLVHDILFSHPSVLDERSTSYGQGTFEDPSRSSKSVTCRVFSAGEICRKSGGITTRMIRPSI